MEVASTTSEQERSTSGYSSQHSQPEWEHSLMIQVRKANEEKAVLQRNLDVLKDEFDRKCSDLRHYRRKCTNLEETQKELQEKISKASGSNLSEPHFEKMNHQKRTIEKLSARIGHQLSEWRRSSNEKDEAILSLEAQLRKIEQCVEKLPKESRALIKPLLKDAGGMNVSRKEFKIHNTLRAELWSVRREHLQNSAMLAIAKQELKEAANEGKARERHLERKIAKQEEHIEKLSGVIDKLIGDERESSNEKTLKITLLEEKVASLKSSLDQSSERNVALVRALQETQGHKKGDKIENLEGLEEETPLKDKDLKIAKLEKEVHSLQTSFGKVFNEKAKLSMELGEAKGYVKTMEKTFQEQAQSLMQKSEAIQQFCQSNVQLSQENVHLKRKLETFMQQHLILEVIAERLRFICRCNIPQERNLLPTKLSLLVDFVETRLAVFNQSHLNFNNDGRSQPTPTVSQSFAALPPLFPSIEPRPANTPTGTAAQSRRAPVQGTVIPSKRIKHESSVGAPPPPPISPQVQTTNVGNDSEEELDVVN